MVAWCVIFAEHDGEIPKCNGCLSDLEHLCSISARADLIYCEVVIATQQRFHLHNATQALNQDNLLRSMSRTAVGFKLRTAFDHQQASRARQRSSLQYDCLDPVKPMLS